MSVLCADSQQSLKVDCERKCPTYRIKIRFMHRHQEIEAQCAVDGIICLNKERP